VAHELRTEAIDVAYPAVDPVTLVLILKAPGDVTAQPGTGEQLLAGALECDAPECAPAVEVHGGEVRFTHPEGWRIDSLLGRDRVNRLNLELGTAKPYALHVKGGIGHASYELGGLPITELLVQAGAAESTIGFARPVLTPMSTLRVLTGAGSLRLEGLLNSSAERFEIKGAAGSAHLHFTGDGLNRDARAEVTAALGSCAILISAGVPARVKVNGAIAQMTIGPGFLRKDTGATFWGGEYATPEHEAGARPSLEIDVTTALGMLSIETV
jgi:hypothetical protein